MRLEAIAARHTKLNKIEKLKKIRTYEDAWKALSGYAKEGYDSIVKEDIDYFLKCFGIYDRPATPGRFMMRVRIPSGRLKSPQALALGNIAKEYGKDYMDLTTRMQVQLRHLRIEDIPNIVKRLESIGLTSWQTGVDNFRNITADPLDGMAFDSLIDTAPLIMQMQKLWLKKGEWVSTLPRKFNTSISGTMTNRCNLFSNDCCFALAVKDGEYGFNVYLGGKVGAVAESADIFLRYEEVLPFYEALIKTYRHFGFRDNRNKNRLHFLIKEAGMQSLTEAICKVAMRNFDRAGETIVRQPRTEERDGRIRLKDGSFALHMVVPSGVFSGTAMMETAELAAQFGKGEINISTTQNLYILGIKEENISKVLEQKPYDRYRSFATPYFNQMVACAGLESCPFGVIPNKPDAIEMAEYLCKHVPLPAEASIRMHWSACVKGCGVHGLGDIGFIGCKTRKRGETLQGVHIQIGGKSTNSQEEAYTVLKGIPLKEAKYYVAELAEAYRSFRKPRESFEKFESRVLRRYSKGAIEFVLRWNVEVCIPERYEKLTFDPMWKPNAEHNEIFLLGLKIYRSFTGQHAYQGIHLFNPIETSAARHICKMNPKIDKALGDIVMKMIAPTNRRYEVFTEIIKALSELCESKF